MLQLKGNAAVIMYVAKGGLSEIPEIVPRLKAGIAAMAGLTEMHSVRQGDVSRIAAQLMDELIEAGLMRRAAQDMLSYFHLMGMATQRTASPEFSAEELLLGSLVSAMRQMRIRNEVGAALLVDWTSALPDGLEQEALRLYGQSTSSARAKASAC